MVTVRRTTEEMTRMNNSSRQSVALLERTAPVYDASSESVTEAEYVDAKRLMRDNLNKILNYDKVEVVEDAVVEEALTEEAVLTETIVDQNSEDIRPTSTTMQFSIDSDVDEMKREMNKADTATQSVSRFSVKGKMVIAIYALAIAVIMTLIVLNTGILAKLSMANEAKAAVLAEKQAAVVDLDEQIASKSDDYIIEKVTGWGWVKR